MDFPLIKCKNFFYIFFFQNAGLINEDELMKDVSDVKDSSAFQKFCGEDDKIKAGKPCENCTCGRKE